VAIHVTTRGEEPEEVARELAVRVQETRGGECGEAGEKGE
jgi:hypothetical protein